MCAIGIIIAVGVLSDSDSFKKEFGMAKVFGITPLELRPGVNGEDFVKFWLEELAPMGQRLGWTTHVLKADRGERVGKYAVIWELPSVESRDRIIMSDGLTAEGKRLLEPGFQTLNEKLATFVTGWPNTDYVELGFLLP
jgi:hypothetical protein